MRYLLNTHWHLDHAGGNAAYMEAFPGLAVIAHVETKKMLDDQVPQMVAEWVTTLDKLAALDAETIVPGHGEVLHDKKYIGQLRDLMQSVITQIAAQLHTNSEASLDDVKKAVNVQQQRDEMLGGDTADAGFFGYALDSFIGFAYHEAKQR